VARDQEARSLELRAALSLARLSRGTDDADGTLRLLAAVHDTFTEGFDTADLVEARTLLTRPGAGARRRDRGRGGDIRPATSRRRQT
jgi:hypothetical protein